MFTVSNCLNFEPSMDKINCMWYKHLSMWVLFILDNNLINSWKPAHYIFTLHNKANLVGHRDWACHRITEVTKCFNICRGTGFIGTSLLSISSSCRAGELDEIAAHSLWLSEQSISDTNLMQKPEISPANQDAIEVIVVVVLQRLY